MENQSRLDRLLFRYSNCLYYIIIVKYSYIFLQVYDIYIYRLIERFLLDDYKPHQLSTYALTLFRYKTKILEKTVSVGICTSLLKSTTL